MTNNYIKLSYPQNKPKTEGWYDTDKGSLYWHEKVQLWSSSEYNIVDRHPSTFYEKNEPAEQPRETGKGESKCAWCDSTEILNHTGLCHTCFNKDTI